MASKLVPLVATVLLLLHAAAATSRISDRAGYSSEECRLQAETRDLSACVQFLNEQEDREDQYYSPSELSGRGSRAFYECCDELEAMRDYSCRCEALRVSVQAARGRSESRGLAGVAERLPQMCGVGPETCQFSSESWY